MLSEPACLEENFILFKSAGYNWATFQTSHVFLHKSLACVVLFHGGGGWVLHRGTRLQTHYRFVSFGATFLEMSRTAKEGKVKRGTHVRYTRDLEWRNGIRTVSELSDPPDLSD